MSNDEQPIEVIQVDAFGGHMVTSDKGHALFRFMTAEEPLNLAVSAPLLPPLLQSVASCQAQMTRRGKMQNSELAVFPVDWWELGSGPSGEIIFSFRLKGTGGFLDFALTADMIPGILETLTAMAQASSNDRAPGTS